MSAKNNKLTTAPSRQKGSQDASPLYLSPTSILAFRQCRRRYKFLYIDKLGDIYGKPKPYFTMANHVHATLKDFLSLRPVELRTSQAAQRLLQRNWRRYRVGFRDEHDEARWAEKALAQLTSFLANYDVTVQPIMMEAFLQIELVTGLVLRGRVDRVDREPDGSVHIIDYKTGNMPEETDWTQLKLHALIASKRLPYPVSKVSYLYLGHSAMLSTEISSEELDQALWDTLNAARKIQREKKFHPITGFWCKNCDFVAICPNKGKAERVVVADGQLELWDELDDDLVGQR